jgi:competence protein ComEC
VHFTVLHPTFSEYTDTTAKTNDRSCVVRIDSVYGAALLTGDIEAISEASLLRTSPRQLAADVLVVPHHGSRTSSTPAFVAAVAPHLAIFAAGYRNRFGHPRAEVIERYERQGAVAMRTDREGAIRIEVGPEAGAAGSLVVQGARALDRRYWRDAPAEAGRITP